MRTCGRRAKPSRGGRDVARGPRLRAPPPAGGRLHQQDLTERTEWSKSVVSRLLTAKEADGQVRRVKVGREKVVGLPDLIPAAAAASAVGGDDDAPETGAAVS